MDDIHREVLRRNWVFLSENLTTSELLDHMLAKCVFTTDMYEEIKVNNTRKDQVSQFLFILLRRGPDAFDKFLAALDATCQGFISEKLAQTCKLLAANTHNQPQPMQI